MQPAQDAGDVTVEVSDADAGPDAAAIGDALSAHVEARFGPAGQRPLLVLARIGDRLAGGLRGTSHWGWLYVRQLFVQEEARGRGLGGLLLSAALDEARRRGCTGVYIDTFDPGVAAFYRRRGFSPVGEIPDFPPGHTRFFLALRL